MRGTHHLRPALLFCALLLQCVCAVGADKQALYFIDAHSQVDQTIDLDTVISLMNQAGVQTTILSAVAARSSRDIVIFARQHPDRIIPAVRMKRRAFNDNDAEYFADLKAEVDSGQFRAMSEVMMYHAQKGGRAPEIVVYPDDDRVQAALRYAVAQNWPFIAHIEFASPSIRDRSRFMRQFEAMLDTYPGHPFALAHLGQLSTGDIRRLIVAHGNLYFLTSRSNPVAAHEGRQPWVNMFRGPVLAPEWRELAIRYPDRFVLSFDNVRPEMWGAFYLAEARVWRRALSELPGPVAQAIAHGNAERLWKIPPR